MSVRYTPGQQILHWVTVVLMFALLPVAWIATSLTEDTPPFYFYLDIHKCLGLAVLALTVVRIAWRRAQPAPPYPRSWSAPMRLAAKVTAGTLLVLMIVMPVTGYLWTTGHGYEVAPFGVVHFPRIAWNNRLIGDAAKQLHLIGRWLVYGFIGLHLIGVSYHLVFKRDGALMRMLPRQDQAEGPMSTW